MKLEGLSSSAFKLNTPAVGLVFFFWPDPDIEIMARLTVLPTFTLLVPGAFLAEGVIDLGQPLPAFGGEQNRVSLDVAVLPKSPGADKKDLLKISKYKYRFGGEVARGEATHELPDRERKFDFLFVEVHYDGDTPLFLSDQSACSAWACCLAATSVRVCKMARTGEHRTQLQFEDNRLCWPVWARLPHRQRRTSALPTTPVARR